MGQTKAPTQQKELAFLVPRIHRSKARYMNLGPLLNWACNTLDVLDRRAPEVLAHCTEGRDVVFAVDSIPAVFGITRDPFIVYSSNMFAILGLRSIYFVLAGMMKSFHYLKFGLSWILIFIGAIMLIADFIHVPIGASLAIIGGVLTLSVSMSIARNRRQAQARN